MRGVGSPEHAGRGVLGGRVDDVADQLSRGALRNRRPQPGANRPNRRGEILKRHIVGREAADDGKAAAGTNLVVDVLEPRIQGPERQVFAAQ